MKIKSKIIISLALSALVIFVGFSAALATESSWQNLNSSIQSGLSGNVNNCSILTVTNGSVAAYPVCTITCNSGYSLSGSTCVALGGGFSGGGGGGSPAPVVLTTSVTINSGAEITNSRNVTLTLKDTNAAYMMVSNLSNFSDASWEAFAASKSWVLTAGDGVKTVYAKYKTSSGNEYSPVSDTITLQVGAIVATTTTTQVTTTGQTTTQTITQTTGQTDVSTYVFQTSLTVGSTGGGVTELQKVLVAEGYLVMPAGVAYGYFGSMTKDALIKYQIAKGITPAVGYFGPVTRKVMNDSVPQVQAPVQTTFPSQNVASMTLKQLVQMLLDIGAVATDKIDAANRLINSL